MYLLIVSIVLLLILFTLYYCNRTNEPFLDTSKIYLLSVYPYQYQNFVNRVIFYSSQYQHQFDWKVSLQKGMENAYQEFFRTSVLPSKTQAFIDDIVNSNNKINLLKLTSFVPTVLSSYFYTYKKADQSYYIKNIPVKTFQEAIDLSLKLKTDFYVDDSHIKELDQIDPSMFNKQISTIPYNGFFYSPVKYTYFDPMDIYLHPSRYSLNEGIGIVDNQQPTYTLFVEKDQLRYLNRLLKNSQLDVPTIHSFFKMPNYSLIWDDHYIEILSSSYQQLRQHLSIKDSFYGSIHSFILTIIPRFNMELNDPSLLFKYLPSSYYWIITYLSLFDSTYTDDKILNYLFTYAKNPSYNPTNCYNEANVLYKSCQDTALIDNLFCMTSCLGDGFCEKECEDSFVKSKRLCETNLEDFKKKCIDNNDSFVYCTSNSDCKNHACGKKDASDNSPYICCPSGETDTWLITDYCTDLKNGDACITDYMCSSHNCDTAQKLFDGTCK